MATAVVPITKAVDIAAVMFAAPDLDRMEDFLLAFGLRRSVRTEDALYMRGSGPSHHIHVTQLAPEAGFHGVAFTVEDRDALQLLASASGGTVAVVDGPGGGYRVRLRDPNGFIVDAVCGQEWLEELPGRKIAPFNMGKRSDFGRHGEFQRVDDTDRLGVFTPGHSSNPTPSKVQRLGHCVLNVHKYEESKAWYEKHFGLLVSDAIYAPKRDAPFGAFLRCDRGSDFTDHHTIALFESPTVGFNHAAFEVSGMDDIMLGHFHLRYKQEHVTGGNGGFAHAWGVGRHILGSQIFDYWRDPWGHVLEHWTDGDQLNASEPARRATVFELMGTQWGPTELRSRL